MNWGKIVLLFQAIITLIMGMIFFSQLTIIDNAEIAELKIEIADENSTESIPQTIIDIKKRYTIAAYILSIISVIELLLISRLIS